jgi:hypothetical protein
MAQSLHMVLPDYTLKLIHMKGKKQWLVKL